MGTEIGDLPSTETEIYKRPPLDEEIFERLNSINVSVLPNLQPKTEALEEQKRQFLNGEIDCPYLTYEDLESLELDRKEADLQSLKVELRGTANYPEPILQAYIWKINEQIAKVRMLKEMGAMVAAMDENASAEVEKHSKRFSKYSEFIYGTPNKPVFNTTLSYIKSKIEALPSDSDIRNTEDFALLNEMLSQVDTEIPALPNMQAKEHGEALDSIADIVARFNQGLEKYNLVEHGWRVVVDETGNRNFIAVNQARKQVLLPGETAILNNRSKARALTPERIKGLIEHEIGTHAVRAKNGSQSKLMLLQSGLDRYEIGEEGLATFREQQEAGADDYAGLHGYLAAGLAKGLDNGGIKRDFGGVFKVLKAYFVVCEGESDDKAKELAWLRCLRTFRGTCGNVPGAIFSKDILYREGNMKIHELHAMGKLDEVEANIGKYDVTNPRHRNVLMELGILT